MEPGAIELDGVTLKKVSRIEIMPSPKGQKKGWDASGKVYYAKHFPPELVCSAGISQLEQMGFDPLRHAMPVKIKGLTRPEDFMNNPLVAQDIDAAISRMIALTDHDAYQKAMVHKCLEVKRHYETKMLLESATIADFADKIGVPIEDLVRSIVDDDKTAAEYAHNLRMAQEVRQHKEAARKLREKLTEHVKNIVGDEKLAKKYGMSHLVRDNKKLTKALEKARAEAESHKQQAEKARAEAENHKQRAEKAEQRAEKAEQRAQENEQRLQRQMELLTRMGPVLMADPQLAQQIHGHIVSGNHDQAAQLLDQFEKANRRKK